MQEMDDEYAEHAGRSIQEIMDIKKYHELGYKGQGIKIAILDSGLGEDYLKALKDSAVKWNSDQRQRNATD